MDTDAGKSTRKELCNPEKEFKVIMAPVIEDCSRQKLRHFGMVLRKYKNDKMGNSNECDRVDPERLEEAFQVGVTNHCVSVLKPSVKYV